MIQNNKQYKPLPREFYNRKTIDVSKDLLGKILVRKIGSNILSARIVELEAYLGEHDPAAHASFGRTNRTKVLYGEPGHAYIFQLRAYHCLNAVAEPLDSPGCVLIRALEPIQGKETMYENRTKKNIKEIELTNGPGKLCQAMDITMEQYGADLTSKDSELQMCEDNENLKFDIEVTKRIGITKAADWDLRFTIKNNIFVSR